VIGGGPIFEPPAGCERFEWDPKRHEWRSAWARHDVVSTSMVPTMSSVSGIVLVNGYTISDQTVGNILKRHGMLPAPERRKTTTMRSSISYSRWTCPQSRRVSSPRTIRIPRHGKSIRKRGGGRDAVSRLWSNDGSGRHHAAVQSA
jgi:hypothetical protein